MITASLCLLALTAVLISFLVRLGRSLHLLGETLKGMQREFAPMVGDMRAISANLASATRSLDSGLAGASRVSASLGHIGDDLEAGRQALKNGMTLLSGSWMSKLKLFGRMLAAKPAAPPPLAPEEARRQAPSAHYDMR